MRQVFWGTLLLVVISSVHVLLFVVMRWDMSKGAGTTRSYEEGLREGRPKKPAPAWIAWPKPQLFLALIVVPLLFNAAAGLIATKSPGKVFVGVVLVLVNVPLLAGCTGLILA